MNPTKPTDPNYSILDSLDNKCKDDKGKFEFKLVWPKRKGPNYNIWKQSTNPVTEKTKVQGYEAVDVKFKSQMWGGLESGYLNSKTPPALLDGSVNHGKVCAEHVWSCCFADHPRLRFVVVVVVVVVVVAHAQTATGNWYYAVGSTGKWGAGMPGASDAETQVELYVKCKLGAGSRTSLIACNYASVRAFACVSSQR